ncbi:MAG: nucleotidyltransferase family protein [Actinomycetota bacterium]
MNSASDEARLETIIRSQPWLIEMLAAMRALALPDAVIAAGCIRNTVWDLLHHREPSMEFNDIDVMFFDPTGVLNESEIDRELSRRVPGYDWQAKNQAFIHEWYRRKLGIEIAPLTSTEAGLEGFVETATAVGVRLEDDDSLTILAPLGLEDLFHLRLRVNERSHDPEYFDQRVTSKGWLGRWPRLTVVAG